MTFDRHWKEMIDSQEMLTLKVNNLLGFTLVITFDMSYNICNII